MARATKDITPETSSAPTWQVVSADALQGVKLSPQVLREVVLALQANQQHSTAHTKTRGQISGGGRKPWRQKGTGRARVGSSRSPLWRGGGITFGPSKLKNYQQKATPRLRRQALLAALRLKAESGQMAVIALSPALAKTKAALKELANVLISAPALIVTTEANFTRPLRNLAGVRLTSVNRLNALDIIRYRQIIFVNDAYTALKGRLKI